jgi:hypothetical protein
MCLGFGLGELRVIEIAMMAVVEPESLAKLGLLQSKLPKALELSWVTRVTFDHLSGLIQQESNHEQHNLYHRADCCDRSSLGLFRSEVSGLQDRAGVLTTRRHVDVRIENCGLVRTIRQMREKEPGRRIGISRERCRRPNREYGFGGKLMLAAVAGH